MKKYFIFLLIALFPISVFAFPLGDVDGNGKVEAKDYILIRKHVLKQPALTGEMLKRADVNGNDDVTTADYILIRKILLGNSVTPTPTITPESGPFVIKNKYDYIVGNFNVLDYGADPTGVKDSTIAFKKALKKAFNCINKEESCSTNNGGVVYVPPGKYKITDQLSIREHVALVGELKEGTADGTVLMIDFGKGKIDNSESALFVHEQAMVRNIAFWYPNQTLSSGEAVKYPPTILQRGVRGLTLENINFINSYIAMDFATHHYNNALQFLTNIYGTPLHTGIINDSNLDTIKIENLSFDSKYWLNSGLDNIPNSKVLSKVLINSHDKPSGIILEKVDWYFLSNVKINGYYHGVLLQSSSNGNAEGEMYDVELSDCFYPVYVSNSRHMAITNSILKASGGNNATALYIKNGANTDISINSSILSSSGVNTIYTDDTKNISVTKSIIKGKIEKINSKAKMTFVSNKLTSTGYDNFNYDSPPNKAPSNVSYNRRITIKPKSSKIVAIDANDGVDITSKINSAIDSLSSTGGIVYIPAGKYKISGEINVVSGIEVIGSIPWAHNSRIDTNQTILTASSNTQFILNDGSGIRGLTIVYEYSNNPSSVKESQKKYTILGKGSNVYIVDVAITNAWRGIDLSSYRCDNHYIKEVWGSFLEKGISVGAGSKNGIIRECHFTTNVMPRDSVEQFKKSFQYTLEKSIAFEIGNTTNQIILNSFVWGTNIGFNIKNGAKDFSIIGGGCDMGNTGVKMSGTINGQLVNMLLTVKPTQDFTTSVNSGNVSVKINVDPTNNNYIESSHTGFVNVVNPILWGNGQGSAIVLSGQGDIHFNGGIIDSSPMPIIKDGIRSLSVYGLIINPQGKTEFQNINGSNGATYVCSICTDGTCNVKNDSGINYGLIDSCIK